MRYSPAAHELESLVNVDCHPVVGVNVETLDHVSELGAGLQSDRLHVCTTFPVNLLPPLVIFSGPEKGEAREDANSLSDKPEGNILGECDLTPEGEQDQLGEDAGVDKVLRARPIREKIHGAENVEREIEEAETKPSEAVAKRGT